MDNYYNITTLHPLGMIAMIALGLVMMLVPRRLAVVPMLAMACFIPFSQRIVVATLDFNLIRLMVLVGWVRVMLYRETSGFRFNALDPVLSAWAVVGAAIMSLQAGELAMVINRAGMLFDALGLYFLFRIWVRSWSDFEGVVRWIAFMSLPVAGIFLIEQLTGRNMFSVFGGVSAITEVRNGRLRCQGPFSHPILAGCCWASVAPLIATLWWSERHRWLGIVGTIACGTIVLTTASSTPASVVVIGFAAACFYPIRHWMSFVRWSGVALLLVLHLTMARPVWHLMARADLFSGSTGWYRYKLFDEFVNHFQDWWLMGVSAEEAANWWEYRFNAITNQFVAEGIKGGLLTLVLFVLSIALAFRAIGRASRTVDRHPLYGKLAFAIGLSIFVHAMSFFGVAYLGQIIVFWYLMIGAAGSLAAANHPYTILARRRAPEPGEAPAAPPPLRLAGGTA